MITSRRAAAAIVLLFPALWAFVIELNLLVVTHAGIRVPDLPASFDGVRIAVVSDIHGGSRFNGPSKLKRLVNMINEQDPDLIFLLGDYVTGNPQTPPDMAPEQVMGLLRPLRARLGSYAVLGNHDWWVTGGHGAKAGLRASSIHLIEDELIPIERGGERIWLLGISDYWVRRRTDYTKLIPAGLNEVVIGLTHNPDVFPAINPPIPLIFAGHTHGGQVWLPLLGRPIVPSEYGQRFAAGLIQENGRQMYVTTGVGTSIMAVRFMVPPEIALVTLRRR